MDREVLIFPVQLTTSRIGNLSRFIHTLAICVTIHTCLLSSGQGRLKPWNQACCGQLMTYPMLLAVHCQLNPQAGSFIPTVMAPKRSYRRGKREGGEELVRKHKLRSGNGRWAGRRGEGRLNPRRETKIQKAPTVRFEEKADLWPQSVFFLRGPTRNGERARLRGAFSGMHRA